MIMVKLICLRHPNLRVPLILFKNLYVPFGIPFDPKQYYKDGAHTNITEDKIGGARRRMTWRQIILALGLHTEEDMVEVVFKAYWQGSERVIPDKGDLRDYWIEISSDRDFLRLGNQRLKGLLMVTNELPLIDLHELRRLNICKRIGDTWALLALGPDRQPNVTVGAVEASKDALVVDEDAQAIPAPVHAPQPPPPAPHPPDYASEDQEG
nr:hypothetical protein [Tanacetum cinerariifolium]